MTMVFFPTAIAKLTKSLDYYTQGNHTNTSAAYSASVKPYFDADRELKRVLQSNNMDLEDLFRALAIPCAVPCIVDFKQIDKCCQYVRMIH